VATAATPPLSVFRDRYTVKAEAQIFNVSNSNVVIAESQTLGSSVTPYLPYLQ